MAGRKKRLTKRRERERSPETREAPPTKLVRTLVAIALAVFGVASSVFFLWYPDTEGPGSGRMVPVHFRGDEPVSEITTVLVNEHLVRDPKLFSFYFRLKGGVAKNGDHLLSDAMSPREIVSRLARDGARVKVVVPEGWTRFDMARRFEKLGVCGTRGFLDATRDRALLEELHVDGPTAEGFLFPATYDLPGNSDPVEIVRRMVHEFDKRWAAIEKAHPAEVRELADGPLHLRRKEIVTLASLVEKEAAVDEERPMVAAVFLNRLRDPSFTPRLLQSDPTAGYGCLVSDAPSCAGYTGKITHEIVSDPTNPFNTYRHEGLPPGPIASPGERAIGAVLAPASTKHLYFVAKGQGRHTFSNTYAEHVEAIKAIHGTATPTPDEPDE